MLVVEAYILRAGMAQHQSTDVPYIPDCIESGDEAAQVLDLQDMRQGLLDVQQPLQQQKPRRRRHRAGRQVREARERREREQEERANRRPAATRLVGALI